MILLSVGVRQQFVLELLSLLKAGLICVLDVGGSLVVLTVKYALQSIIFCTLVASLRAKGLSWTLCL